MLFDAEDKDDLILKAKKRGDQAPKVYQKSVELYYIARYFVALFEARNHAVPIQVWNEYRNALDHFFRHLTKVGLTPEEQGIQGSTHKSNQLKAMESHITRAVLDILKLSSHRSDDWYREESAKHSAEIIILVGNGSFSTETKKKYLEALNLFSKAKTYDHDFGVSVTTNKKIVNAYLDAAFAYEELRKMYEDNTENINNALIKYEGIKRHAEASAHRRSFIPNIKAGFVASLIFALFSFGVGYFISNFSEKESNIMSLFSEKNIPAKIDADSKLEDEKNIPVRIDVDSKSEGETKLPDISISSQKPDSIK